MRNVKEKRFENLIRRLFTGGSDDELRLMEIKTKLYNMHTELHNNSLHGIKGMGVSFV